MRLGILGGGQLAQMMLETEYAKAHEFLIYSNTEATPTKNMAEQIIADYQDETALKQFANRVDVVTFETETIPAFTLKYLKKQVQTYPAEQSLIHFQDRLLEKTLFNEVGIATNKFVAINNNDDLDIALSKLGLPFIIKARTNGYDGKLQWRVKSQQDLNHLKQETQLTNCIAEEFIAFDREVSIIGARSASDAMCFYDLCENYHKDDILRYTLNKKNDRLQNQAEAALKKAMQKTDHVGMMAIEFFVKENQLLANEVAPRVHNSGHWTIEGAKTSQFENHLRAITNASFGETTSIHHALMFNFIGSFEHKEAFTKLNFIFHDYHKTPRAKRKLAHATLVTDDNSDIQAALKFIDAILD